MHTGAGNHNNNMEVLFKETDEIGLLLKRNFKICCKAGLNRRSTTVDTAIIDIVAVLNLKRQDVLPFKWRYTVRMTIERPRLISTSGQALQMNGEICLCVKMRNNIASAFGVIDRFAVEILLWTSYIDRRIRYILFCNFIFQFPPDINWKFPFFSFQFIDWQNELLLIVQTCTFCIGSSIFRLYWDYFVIGLIWLVFMELILHCHQRFLFDVVWLWRKNRDLLNDDKTCYVQNIQCAENEDMFRS